MKPLRSMLLLSFLVAAGLLVLAGCSSSVDTPSPTTQPSPTVSAPTSAPEPALSPSPSPTEAPAPTPAPTKSQASQPTPAVTIAPTPVRATDCGAYADFGADREDPSLGYVQLDYPELTVELIDRSDGNITRWEWDFDGDGITDLDYGWPPPDSPLKGGYPRENTTYDVTLTVTDSQGCTDTFTRESYIRVDGCPE